MKKHCQHCGEEIPYHGLWMKPKKLEENRHLLNATDIIYKQGSMMRIGMVMMHQDKVIIHSYQVGALNLNEIDSWMPAPD